MGRRKYKYGGKVLDDLSITLTIGHSCGIINQQKKFARLGQKHSCIHYKTCSDSVTSDFDPTHDLGLGSLRWNFEMGTQEWVVWFMWNEKGINWMDAWPAMWSWSVISPMTLSPWLGIFKVKFWNRHEDWGMGMISEVLWQSPEGSLTIDKPQPSISKISLKITHLRFHSNLRGDNEL